MLTPLRSLLFILLGFFVIPAMAENCGSTLGANLFEQGAQVRELRLGLMERLGMIELPEDSNLEKLKRNIFNLQRIADKLATQRLNQNVRTVFYPAAGYDAETPVVLFPHATTYVNVDLVAFHDRAPTVNSDIGEQHDAFILFGDVLDKKSIAGILVGRLSVAVPGFRLRKIEAWQESRLSYLKEPVQNGIIYFDTGEGTELKRFIHIQQDLYETDTDSKWFQELTAHGYEAVVSKALELHVALRNVLPTMFDTLNDRNGVIVEERYGSLTKAHSCTNTPLANAQRMFWPIRFGHDCVSVISFRH